MMKNIFMIIIQILLVIILCMTLYSCKKKSEAIVNSIDKGNENVSNVSNSEETLLNQLNPQDVFRYFLEICKIPHGSGNTKAISDYLVNFAKTNNLKYEQDSMNNVIIYKPSKNKTKPTIGLQGHIDMVCVKTKDSTKDMKKEGIEPYIDGKYLRAKDTTLGADDGIGVSLILSILANNNDYNRDIVGVFTIDEETGMYGAKSIDLSNTNIKHLLNIDQEEFDSINVGCAGGTRLEYDKDCNTTEINNAKVLEVSMNDCLGGHSGVDITKNRTNANKFLCNVLKKIFDEVPFYLISIDGGTFNNAITTDSKAKIIANNDSDKVKIIELINKYSDAVEKNKANEPKAYLKCEETNEIINKAITIEDSNKVLTFFSNMPDGLIRKFEEYKDVAETSLNVGVIKTNNNKISFADLVRSNVNNNRLKLVNEIEKLALENGFNKKIEESYNAWEHKKTDFENTAVNTYKKLFNEDPRVEVTHGGLECGTLLEKLKDADALAIGPTISDPHTVNENLEISTVQKIYDYIIELLKVVE